MEADVQYVNYSGLKPWSLSLALRVPESHKETNR
jgi:hypothetical protein